MRSTLLAVLFVAILVTLTTTPTICFGDKTILKGHHNVNIAGDIDVDLSNTSISNLIEGSSAEINSTNIENIEGIAGGNATAEGGTAIIGDVAGGSASVGNIANRNTNFQDQDQNQNQSQLSVNTNGGNTNAISITDSRVHNEMYPTGLLSPTGYAPKPGDLFDYKLHLSKSPYALSPHRILFSKDELTRFANPGRFLHFLWPEWDNKYFVEIALFSRSKPQKIIILIEDNKPNVNAPVRFDEDWLLVKIGEAHAFAKDLNKSEHQVLAALAVKAAKCGARVVVWQSFSNPITKVDSFVIGGGAAQTGGPGGNSIFNGATGIGSSTCESLTRPTVIATLYK